MKFDALNVIELRENFVRQVISPLITRYPYEFGKELNIKVCLKRKDNHFFERVLGRSIDKGRLGDSNDNYRKHWDLVPLTVLKDNDNFQHQYRIDL
jgi:hypothetical protein